jgi:hypothetical protein
MLSVLIPARNEIYLEKTIRSILENAEGEIEILVALDGWVPDPPFDVGDNRVIFYKFDEPIGHLKATNELAKVAKGKFIMKLDAHCAVDKGFDVKLAADCEPSWTVIPRMYNLDVETWKPKDFDDFNRAVRRGKMHDYISMGMEKGELRTQYYPHGFNKEQHHSRKDILIDDTLSCMGCCFFMHKDRFLEQGGCDVTDGRMWGQQAIEVACKAWLSGGSLKVNKKTWFAHYFRGGGGEGFPYQISGNHIDRVRAHSTDLWMNDKWPLAKRKFQWLLDKFNPPNWNGEMKKDPINIESELQKYFNWRTPNLPWYPRRGRREDLAVMFGKLCLNIGVEIGTRNGNFAEVLCNANKNIQLTCVDPFAGHIAKHYDETVKKLSKYNVKVMRSTSMDAVDSFKDESIDFVYIDGNHTFDYVMMDIIRWTPKVRNGGIIAGHDFDCVDVRCAFEAYTRCHNISPWYRTREQIPTVFWVKK